MEDERFSHIAKDPRFRRMKQAQRKVKIDKRFEGMFKDKRFQLKYTVDKRGRPVTNTSKEDLQKFYELSESESEDEEGSKKKKKKKKKVKAPIETDHKLKQSSTSKEKKTGKTKQDADITSDKLKNVLQKQKHSSGELQKSVKKVPVQKESDSEDDSSESEEDEDDDDDDMISEEEIQSSGGDSETERGGHGIDLARGEGNIETSDSSSSDDDSSEEGSTEDPEHLIEHGWGEWDKEAPVVEDATRRMAVCNMDWDRIKAQDILALLSSFKPTGGIIHSVTIYPSDFGLERMKEEDLLGPKELREDSGVDSNMTDAEGSKYHREKLRQYQLNRFKYYYAIVECDSVETANQIYTECDGIEYESSATKLDLRFVPDDMTFDQAPKDSATEISSTYKPSMFHSSALQQSHVNLTWDETNPDRVQVMNKKYTKDDLDNMNVDDYLASDSGDDDQDPYAGLETPEFGEASSEDEDEDGQIEKYRRLLLGKEQKKQEKEEKDVEMEITWEPGLKESTQEMVESKQKVEKSLTPWQHYLEKKMEKKKLKKKHVSGEEVQAFSDDELPEGVDVDDDFFKDETHTSKVKDKTKKRKGKKPSTEELEQKDELTLLALDDDDISKEHFNLKKIMQEEKRESRKRKKKDAEKTQMEDTFQINVKDSRFAALYDTPAFNIDPSAPEFKKTKAIEALINEKIRQREEEEKLPPGAKKAKQNSGKRPSSSSDTGRKVDVSLATLVKSVKAKTQSVRQKKKR